MKIKGYLVALTQCLTLSHGNTDKSSKQTGELLRILTAVGDGSDNFLQDSQVDFSTQTE